MKAFRKGFTIIGILGLLAGFPQAIQASEDKAAKPLHVNLLWTYHCPPSPKLSNGVYTQPWVRLRAVRDCAGMVDLIERSPGLKVSFSLSPLFIEQLKSLNEGRTDRCFQLAEIPADRLRESEKKEVLSTFFSVPPAALKRFHGYARLKGLARLSVQDWRDLQTFFFLSWLPEENEEGKEPMEGLFKKSGGFSEEQKMMVLARHRQTLRQLLPRLKRLQSEGRIEVATTPYSHPVLPLILDSGIAANRGRNSLFSCDAKEQIDKGIGTYYSAFGCGPRGMWPPEGAVSPGIPPLLKRVGLRWMASGEKVFAASGLEGNGLYHPWQLKGGPAIFFRNDRLCEEIRTRYPQLKGEEAAKILLDKLDLIARENQEEDSRAVATLILDGATVWDSYPDAGRGFLRAFYQGLVGDPHLKTILPSEYLSRYPLAPLERLAAGWLGGTDFKAWIGPPSKAQAWSFLAIARQRIEDFARKHSGDPRTGKALDAIYRAEGSDGFHPSPSSLSSWDGEAVFRKLLLSSYRQIGQKAPVELLMTLARPQRAPQGDFTPRLDGNLGEWTQTGRIDGKPGDSLSRLGYGWDKNNLYLGLTFHETVAPYFLLQFGLPEREGGKRVLKVPFRCHYRAELSLGGGTLIPLTGHPIELKAAASRRMIEIRIPWTALALKPNEELLLMVIPGGSPPFPERPLLIRR